MDEMKTQYLVIKREKCRECGGSGWISNELYREFAEKFEKPWNEVHGSSWTEEKCEAGDEWWAEKGYPGGVNNWPPEEWQCDECNGCGVFEGRIELCEALKAIGWKRNECKC